MTQLSTRNTVIIAAEINSIKDQTRKMLLHNSIEIGRRLVEAKAMLPHGEWGKWLQESVDYSQSTANNLMKIFEQYGSDQLSLFGDNTKSQAFVNLSYSQAVALLGVPHDEREQFVIENDVESMSTRQLQQAIKEKQQLEQQLQESEARAKAAAEAAEQERRKQEQLNNSLKKLELQSRDHQTIVDNLKDQLEKAKAAGDKTAADQLQAKLDKQKSDLDKSRKRIAELEAELKKKPAKEVVEKVPEAVEQELTELRKKLATSTGSQAMAKFKFTFESLVSGFGELLTTLDEIKASDPDVHEKYKGAVSGLLGKMAERIQ